MKAVPLPEDSFGSVSIRRIPNSPLACGDADSPEIGLTSGPRNQERFGAKNPRSTTVFPILASPTNADSSRELSILIQGYLVEIVAARFFRPRRRRRERTRRPAFVAILRRKPWVRLREMLLGWKVRFMASAPE